MGVGSSKSIADPIMQQTHFLVPLLLSANERESIHGGRALLSPNTRADRINFRFTNTTATAREKGLMGEGDNARSRNGMN